MKLAKMIRALLVCPAALGWAAEIGEVDMQGLLMSRCRQAPYFDVRAARGQAASLFEFVCFGASRWRLEPGSARTMKQHLTTADGSPPRSPAKTGIPTGPAAEP